MIGDFFCWAMIEALAEKTIRKGLPKRERELLCKFLREEHDGS